MKIGQIFRSFAILSLNLLFSYGAFAGEAVKILNYNLGLLSVPIVGDQVPIVSERAKVLIEELPARLQANDTDLAVFQELWNDNHARALTQQLSDQGYLTFRPSERVHLAYGNGIVIAAKKKFKFLHGPFFIPFQQQAGIQKLTKHGFTISLIQAEGGSPFIWVGAHTQNISTQNGFSTKPDEYYAHWKQMEQLGRTIDSWIQSYPYPVLLAGDFNVGPDYAQSLYWNVTQLEGFKNHSESALSPFQRPMTWDKDNPLVKFGLFPDEDSALIDHILSRDGAQKKWRSQSVRVTFFESHQIPASHSCYNKSFRQKTYSQPTNSYVSPLSDHYAIEGIFELTDALTQP